MFYLHVIVIIAYWKINSRDNDKLIGKCMGGTILRVELTYGIIRYKINICQENIPKIDV